VLQHLAISTKHCYSQNRLCAKLAAGACYSVAARGVHFSFAPAAMPKMSAKAAALRRFRASSIRRTMEWSFARRLVGKST
jgi:hypothetical protein